MYSMHGQHLRIVTICGYHDESEVTFIKRLFHGRAEGGKIELVRSLYMLKLLYTSDATNVRGVATQCAKHTL